MLAALTLIWLTETPSSPHLAAQVRAWATAKHVVLREPAPRASALHYDPALVAQIEALIEDARMLASAEDTEHLETTFGSLDSLLEEHVELPQLAWLKAETLRLRAQHSRSRDEQTRLNAEAAALEGERTFAFSENANAALATAGTALQIQGLTARDQLEWDGQRHGLTFESQPGRHHVRVWRSGRPIYGAWLTVTNQQSEVHIGAPILEPCSRDDLGEPRLHAERLFNAAGIACAHWLVARANPAGQLELAECHYSACSPFRVFEPELRLSLPPPQHRAPENQAFPRWASYGLVAGGVLAAGTLILWQAGVFSRAEPAPKTVLVFEGLGSSPALVQF